MPTGPPKGLSVAVEAESIGVPYIKADMGKLRQILTNLLSNAIKFTDEEIPIIAITASAFREQRQEILAAGCNDMVIKPFQAHEIFETMGRFLNIAYIYEPEREAAPSRKVETQLTSAMLADLPAELLQELRGANLSLNSDAISAVIERIEPLAPDTANGLRTLLDNMQMGRLQELIEKAG